MTNEVRLWAHIIAPLTPQVSDSIASVRLSSGPHKNSTFPHTHSTQKLYTQIDESAGNVEEKQNCLHFTSKYEHRKSVLYENFRRNYLRTPSTI